MHVQAGVTARGKPRRAPASGSTVATALARADELKGQRRWAQARTVLLAAEQLPGVSVDDLRHLRQQRAVCTYKDPELRLVPSLEEGLRILASAGEDLAVTRDPETLGIAGAIHKRMWEVSGRRRQLATALGYYLRGADAAEGADSGYTAVNAAFLLDALARLDEQTARAAGLEAHGVPALRSRARALRHDVLSRHGAAAEAAARAPDPAQWWLVATVAEAALGVGDHIRARHLLSASANLPDLPDWELESTVRQLTTLARLMDVEADARSAAEVVAEVVGRPTAHVLSLTGRMGLALSGGGFRASFFHLGVLARLAELDVLRHVEVLSCVSGGSIVGAHYYLELRRRLQRLRDEEMTRAEYIDVVRTVQRDFYAATTHNVRRRALTNPVAVLRMLLEPGYNRSTRVGDLLEKDFYRPLVEGSLALRDLGVTPREAPHPFDPQQHNWRRSAKVPLLIINATTLNTGHNWQFTTSWMGEPYGFIDERTDANYRLARVRLRDQVPGTDLTIGRAVAASASVPGMLEPVPVPGTYPGKRVQVVDGGVEDNQGINGLLAEDCTVLVVSDASGQMNAEDDPSTWPWSTARRANSILMATVRSRSFRQLDDLRRAGLLDGLLFLHLKRDLRAETVDARPGTVPLGRVDAGWTSYGMPRRLQRHLAGIRTDLDVFSAAEASTLMLSGYRMTRASFPEDLPDVPCSAEPPVRWTFQVVERAVDDGEESPRGAALARLLHMPPAGAPRSQRRDPRTVHFRTVRRRAREAVP